MKPWNTPHFDDLLKLALWEDIGTGDITTEILTDEDQVSNAVMKAKSDFIVSGQLVAERVFSAVDASVKYSILHKDGQFVESGSIISAIHGSTSSLLAAERTALNFLQRMSGIATATHHMVKLIGDLNCKVIDTRKTVPGHRLLDKYAVLCGGGANHRTSLSDGILIKENHINAAGSVTRAVRVARERARHNLIIQIEVKSVQEAVDAVEAGADALLLDNMTPQTVKGIAHQFSDKVLLECSGNLSAETVADYAEAGAHLLSVGALTHSVIAADISMLFK